MGALMLEDLQHQLSTGHDTGACCLVHNGLAMIMSDHQGTRAQTSSTKLRSVQRSDFFFPLKE